MVYKIGPFIGNVKNFMKKMKILPSETLNDCKGHKRAALPGPGGAV
jgi:hypothetical protein